MVHVPLLIVCHRSIRSERSTKKEEDADDDDDDDDGESVMSWSPR